MADNTTFTVSSPTKNPVFRSFIWWILWGLAIAVELYLLLNDVSLLKGPDAESYFRGDLDPVAELKTYHSDVRFQNPNQLIWDDVQAQQSFFPKQSLMTLGASGAEIEFSDGSRKVRR